MSVLDLNGIADHSERKRLRRQADHITDRSKRWKLFLPLMAANAAAAIFLLSEWGSRISVNLTRNGRLNTMIVFFAFSYSGGVLGYLWRRRDQCKALAELLKYELRCTSCGYSLKGSSGDLCPECGAPRPFPMTGRDAAIGDK